VGITCLNDQGYVPGRNTRYDVHGRVDPDALERAHGFVLELVRALDRDVGRRASR
jgi:hypothetical protein